MSERGDDRGQLTDPLEILGVEEGADEQTLKRAYVALIKRYRPDRAPEEFMRVRKAYEDVLARLRWESMGQGTDETVHIRLDPGAHPTSDLARRVKRLFDDGDDSAAIDELARAMVDGEEAALVAVELCGEEELARLVVRPEVSWDQLTKQSNRWAAIGLLRRRFEQMILRSDARVLAEISATVFRRDLLGEDELEELALSALIRAAWEGDQRVDELLAMLGDPTAGRGSYRHYRVTEAQMGAESWQRFRQRWRCPPSLARLFMMFEAVGPHGKEALLRELDGDLRRHPQAILATLDALSAFDPRLLERFFGVVDELNYDIDEDIGDLAGERLEFIEARMSKADSLLRNQTGQAKTWLATAAGIALCIVAFPSSVGAAAATGLLVTVGFWQFLPEYAGYYKNARPLICEIVTETGVRPDHILAWIRRNSRIWNRVRFETSFEGDVALQLYSDLARLCIAWRRCGDEEE